MTFFKVMKPHCDKAKKSGKVGARCCGFRCFAEVATCVEGAAWLPFLTLRVTNML